MLSYPNRPKPNLQMSLAHPATMIEQMQMKDMSVRIDKAGRIVLPKRIRETLALQPGDVLKISTYGNEILLQSTKAPPGFVRRGRALVFSCGSKNVLDQEIVSSIIAEGRRRAVPHRRRARSR